MKKLIAILMSLMMLTCAFAEDAQPSYPWEIIEEDGKTFIKVTGNPSTGYIWTVFPIVGDIVNVTDPTPVEKETADEALEGAPVEYRIEVEALTPGETILVLRYLRPWEMDIAKECPILVNVDENNALFFMPLDGMPWNLTAVEIMADEHMILAENETIGQVLCTFPEDMPLPTEGENIRVWFNGVMALSLPGRINVLGWETVAPPQARMMEAPVDETP